ncbi:MAG: hypothetical protein GWP05_11080 [Anaerolineaceae bacterium]|nr:hypothetical protein [Anaerolineaceae bacterium]
MRRTFLLPVFLMLVALWLIGCDREKKYTLMDLISRVMPKDRPAVLQEAIVAEDADIRREAIHKMSKWKDASDEMVELVGLTLLGDPDRMVRAQAAQTLGVWANPASLECLIKTVRTDDDAFVRADCAAALGRLESDEVSDVLADRLRFDGNADVRIACAKALKLHRGKAAAEGLLPGLMDRDLAVRGAAEQALRFMTGQDLGGKPDPWRKFLSEADDPLAEYGHPPKRKKRRDQRVDPDAEKKAKIRQIFKDLFPLERKKGPFD